MEYWLAGWLAGWMAGTNVCLDGSAFLYHGKERFWIAIICHQHKDGLSGMQCIFESILSFGQLTHYTRLRCNTKQNNAWALNSHSAAESE
eukprot:scaffold31815_cov47-Attheya_sp.AAC.1